MDKTKLSKALKAAFTKFEEGDDATPATLADTIAAAVADAVTGDSQDATVEDRLKKLEDAVASDADTSMSARLKKLEDASSAEPTDDEKKESEEQMKKLAASIADEKITKFTAEIGLKKAASGQGGFVPVNDTKTKFEAAIQTNLSAGAKDRAVAIARLAKEKPEIYNAARTAGLF